MLSAWPAHRGTVRIKWGGNLRTICRTLSFLEEKWANAAKTAISMVFLKTPFPFGLIVHQQKDSTTHFIVKTSLFYSSAIWQDFNLWAIKKQDDFLSCWLLLIGAWRFFQHQKYFEMIRLWIWLRLVLESDFECNLPLITSLSNVVVSTSHPLREWHKPQNMEQNGE